MKVLFVFNGDFNEGNAANARLKSYGKGLKEIDVDSEFLVLRPSEFGDSGINSREQGQVEGLKFKYLSGRTDRAKGKARLVELLKIWFSFFKQLNLNSADNTVLYFYSSVFITHFPILALSKLLGYKSIIELTELHSLKVEATPLKTLFAKFNNGLIEWTLPWWFNQGLFTSRRLRLFYRRRFKHFSSEIIPVVFDNERFQGLENIASKRTNRVGYLGSFGPKDNVEGIIKAFGIAIKNAIEPIQLRLIGYQSSGFNLDTLLDENNLKGKADLIEATGQVASKDIPKLLAECDLLIMNRNKELFSNYGFPIKLAEYLATGRPCICTNVSDISHYFKSGVNCEIIEPESPEILSEKIIERYAQYNKWSEIGLNGQERGHELFQYKRHVLGIKGGSCNLLT
ncbi:MAG: glycosyltransferase [Bacteroidia bacterium]